MLLTYHCKLLKKEALLAHLGVCGREGACFFIVFFCEGEEIGEAGLGNRLLNINFE